MDRVYASVEPNLKQLLDEEAAEKSISVSQLIRNIIGRHFAAKSGMKIEGQEQEVLLYILEQLLLVRNYTGTNLSILAGDGAAEQVKKCKENAASLFAEITGQIKD